MLDQSWRAAILKLRQQGHSIRGIARAMKLSRGAVRAVLRSASEAVPVMVRQHPRLVEATGHTSPVCRSIGGSAATDPNRRIQHLRKKS
jgi:hypothetical protein